MRNHVLRVVVLMCSLGSGCEDVNNMFATNESARVEMSMVVSGVDRMFGGRTQAGIVDSIRIDSAIVVLSRIKIESQLDEEEDTSRSRLFDDNEDEGMDDDDADDDERDDSDESATFRGPFVVVVRDTTEINLGSASLLPGYYTIVKMKVHKLKPWEVHSTIDRTGRHDAGPKRYLGSTGSSLMAWGSISKDSVWHPFEFALDGEFRIVRTVDLTVSVATQTVPLALHVDAREWFIHPRTGELLDPFDISAGQRAVFRLAIHRSFYEGEFHECDDRERPFRQ